MVTTREFSNLSQEEAQAARSSGQLGHKTMARVIYYKRPPGGQYGGWIVWQDAQESKQMDYVSRGFQPIRLFDQRDRRRPLLVLDSYDVWGPILRHPDGPALFPKGQVISNRWYNARECPVAGVRFPQLEGVTLTIYKCPECDGERIFHEAIQLARHLRSKHKYDRLELSALGRELGIDFSKVFQLTQEVKYEFKAEDGVSPEDLAPEPRYEVQTVQPRGRSYTGTVQVNSGYACEVCGRTFGAKIALAGHMRSHKEVLEGADGSV